MNRAAGHVLIVDDEESICWGLKRLLTGEGHEVSVASTAEEALALASRHKPDLVVMDVRLPGIEPNRSMRVWGGIRRSFKRPSSLEWQRQRRGAGNSGRK